MTLLFVSAATGRALKNYIVLNQQLQINAQKEIDTTSNETVNELEQDDRFFGYNLVVHLDGTSPYFEQTYRGLNMAAYFLVSIVAKKNSLQSALRARASCGWNGWIAFGILKVVHFPDENCFLY